MLTYIQYIYIEIRVGGKRYAEICIQGKKTSGDQKECEEI
jgi:hypothetical protein